jgi:hypothetical protein
MSRPWAALTALPATINVDSGFFREMLTVLPTASCCLAASTMGIVPILKQLGSLACHWGLGTQFPHRQLEAFQIQRWLTWLELDASVNSFVWATRTRTWSESEQNKRWRHRHNHATSGSLFRTPALKRPRHFALSDELKSGQTFSFRVCYSRFLLGMLISWRQVASAATSITHSLIRWRKKFWRLKATITAMLLMM